MRKQIISKIRLLFSLIIMFSIISCTDESIVSSGNQNLIDENGMVQITLRTNVPAWKVARAVDAGGEGIATMWVLTFNKEGNMINRVMATNVTHVNSGDVTAEQYGTFTVTVPAATRIIHVLGNVIMDNFSDRDNIGHHENEVIGNMITSSGALTFWGRKTFEDQQALLDFVAEGSTDYVTLYRNQAIVRYGFAENSTLSENDIEGMAVCNTKAYGTVAPFDGTTRKDAFNFSLDNDFVTALPEKYNVKQTNPTDVSTFSGIGSDPRYVFENENPGDDQFFLIFKISGLYYKILLVDDTNKNPYQIIRNHLYTVEFSGINTNYGVQTFKEALNATPANNPLIAVKDEIPEVSYGSRTLAIVGETTRLYQKAGTQDIEYTYNGDLELEVSWVSNEGVTDGDVTLESKTDEESSTNVKVIRFTTREPGTEVVSGTLLLKEKSGPLSRRIKVFLAPKFDFSPVWVSSEIPLLTDEAITVLFNIPDNYPEELLSSLEVKFASNLIDVQKGESLRVIAEKTEYVTPVLTNPENLTSWNWTTEPVTKDWNYKYVYDDIEDPGQYRVNFRTLLTGLSSVDTENFHIYMEDGNGYFNSRDLYFAFQPVDDNTRVHEARRIMLNNGDAANNYITQTMENLNPVSGEEIIIPFTLGTLTGTDGTTITEDANVSASNPVYVSVYYDPSLLEPNFTYSENGPQEDLFGNKYVTYVATSATNNTLKFTTMSPNFDSYVVLAAKSTGGYRNKYNNSGNNSLGYRSASVTIRSRGRIEFSPVLTPSSIPYGIGQEVKLKVGIPGQVGTHSYTIRLGTSNLEPVDAGWTQWLDNDGKGYDYVVPENHASEMIFTFKTKNIVSAETLTLVSSGNVAFNDAIVELTNTLSSGTITLPAGAEFTASPYISLQRSDGTRIGTFSYSGNLTGTSSVAYELTLQGEYDLHNDDKVSVIYAPINSNDVYVNEIDYTLEDLLGTGKSIQLIKRQ